MEEAIKKIATVQYTLASFFFLFGILIIILACALPGVSQNTTISFSIVGALQTLTAIIFILAVPVLSGMKPME
jgi:hypothetical protein